MSEPNNQPLPDQAVLREAAEWFARIGDESATQRDSSALKHWLSQHPDHVRAWSYVQRVAGRFHQATEAAGRQGTRSILDSADVDEGRRKALIGSGLGCLALVLGWRYTPFGDYAQRLANNVLADRITDTGQIADFELADGGRIWLNTATAIDVRYDDVRHITLHQGEVFVETAPDERKRPFIVTTRHGSLTALGTRFNVYQQDESTLLAVFDGAVRIKTLDGQERIVAAGNQVSFGQHVIHASRSVRRARQAWTRGVLQADNISLRDFVQELSRYQHGHIGVADEVAQIKVIGAYPIDRPDHTLEMLANALPVAISRPLPWWTNITPR
jgi:transmembrane sensor